MQKPHLGRWLSHRDFRARHVRQAWLARFRAYCAPLRLGGGRLETVPEAGPPLIVTRGVGEVRQTSIGVDW
jgi:hypothetical protein